MDWFDFYPGRSPLTRTTGFKDASPRGYRCPFPPLPLLRFGFSWLSWGPDEVRLAFRGAGLAGKPRGDRPERPLDVSPGACEPHVTVAQSLDNSDCHR